MALFYTVQKGDTLYRISKRFGVSVQAILTVNPHIQSADYIIPGQVLTIPNPTAQWYVIQPGDTFYYIARRFGVSLTDLLAANPGLDPGQLQIGQHIVIPYGTGMGMVDTSVPYGYPELVMNVQEMQQLYPFLRFETIGQSVLGKHIYAIVLGTGSNQIHINASIHANEWITSPITMKFIENCAAAYQANVPYWGYSIRQLFEQHSLWIVPMINPDGVQLVQEGLTADHPYYAQLLEWNRGSFQFSGWKANIHGVDLNDQFPAHWEEEKERRAQEGPGPRDYPGEAPLTEPEAIALADLTRRQNFSMVLSLHTQGQEIYWNYRDLEPPESEGIANRFAQVSGYRAVKLNESDAGYKDWFIQDFRRPGFTIEAGIGQNPLPLSQFDDMYRAVVNIIFEATKV